MRAAAKVYETQSGLRGCEAKGQCIGTHNRDDILDNDMRQENQQSETAYELTLCITRAQLGAFVNIRLINDFHRVVTHPKALRAY